MRLAALLLFTAAQAPPAFEVATVKPSPPRGSPTGIAMRTYPGGRVRITGYRLKMLIHDAYSVEDYQIIGGPAWSDLDRFDVEAKAPAPSSPSQIRLMLQQLLAERFQLHLHRETRREAVYTLVVAKGGPKLKPPQSATAEPFVWFLPRGFEGRNATVDQLANRLASNLKRPVRNRTELEGHFDFRIEWTPDDAGTDENVLLLSALQEQAGLKLETEPGSVEVIVIDHAKKPSAN
jgi:uncharacterized protein (TIGR03435 family)